MKNKVIYLIMSLFMTLCSVNAASDKIHVCADQDFDTQNPTSRIDVTVLSDSNVGNYNLKAGDVLHCEVLKIIKPKRGKRSGGFEVSLDSFTTDNETIQLEEKYYGKYADKILSKEELKNVDAKKVGKKAVISVGNHFVKGVAPVASLAQGMIKNEDGNRIESGVKQVYKDSYFSYVEKGQYVKIESGEQFYLIFKNSKNKKSSD